MLDWLVITADRTGVGRGVRGYTLAWFLQTYFGRRAVAHCTPDQWRASRPRADTLFVGLPSSLTADDIERLASSGRCRRVVAFDYLDQQPLQWSADQEAALRRLTDQYLKPWYEAAWDYDLRMGLLPIRTSRRLTAAILASRCAPRIRRRPEPLYDVAFLGQPNTTSVWKAGQIVSIDQRFNWLREIRSEAPQLKFWGGLMGGSDETTARLRQLHGDVSHLYHPTGKVNFWTYFRALRRSRVLLAPGGNAPWSYRHYEGLYAGGVVVTIDYRRRDMLVPLPCENMVHVPDDAPVLPAVWQALAMSRQRPSLGEENFAWLQRYLRFGAYSRRRPALMERFLAQLE
ncbi:MAG: hypothetical protein DCC67_14155 [Planctomycetota bacterium]|nr:MAG: hypothetical protein DCC67_14155 [Planctomycetota bacterium]